MKEQNWLTFKQKISIILIRGHIIDTNWSNLLYDIKQAVTSSFPEKKSTKNYTFTAKIQK